MTRFTVQVFFFFYTRNEYYIILSFVFYACICQQANTVRVYIILYNNVNSTTEETWWSLQSGVGKIYIIYRYLYRLSAKWVVKYRHIRYQHKIQYHASLVTAILNGCFSLHTFKLTLLHWHWVGCINLVKTSLNLKLVLNCQVRLV